MSGFYLIGNVFYLWWISQDSDLEQPAYETGTLTVELLIHLRRNFSLPVSKHSYFIL
jgi:hypothetical protein